jgi:NADPH-dependent glutamate synthase beta subunit-like oxidoreductase
MPEERKLILKLCQKVTDRIGHKVTVDDPDYKGLACVLTDEMAAIALKMKKRVPVTAPVLAKRCGMSVEKLEEILKEMSIVGIIEYNWENEKREKQYMLPMYVPGCAEFMNMNKELVEAHHEVADFFHDMSRLPLEGLTEMVPLGGSGIGMHVIPVEKAIESCQEAVDVEKISYWLKKYEGKYSVGACSCRRARRIRGEGCGHLEDDICIGVGDMADYCVETGKGRYVTYDEVMEILKRAEDNGLVHQITNIDGEDKIFAVCNCCNCSCFALRTSQLFNTPNMSRSAYVARVDKDKCVACGQCVEYCPAGAVRLGQKLCTKSGEIEYPKQELPDEVKWGRDKWNEDYRDSNRKNCYDTGTAPCKTKCPAHIAVQGYIKLAAQGRYAEALELIKKENPFPAVCGRVCNRACEDACTRGTIDQPVAIDEIKKFIAERDLKAETRFVPKFVNMTGKPFEQKIAVIGAGPSGMSCAYYLALKGYKNVTVFEKEAVPGGMLTFGIPSFRLEKDVINAEIDVLKELGIEFRCGVEVGKDITIDELRKQGYKGFYMAIGAQGGRKIGVPGEDAKGVQSGIDFMRNVNLGKKVRLSGKTIVIGGGNVAVDVARTALRAGSSKVTMVCIEDCTKMPASHDEVEEAVAEGIEITYSRGPKEIIVQDGRVKGISLKKCTCVFDSCNRFNPAYDDEDVAVEECDNILLSIGQSIVWGDMLKGESVELNRNNTIKADALTCATAQNDIFAGGDVVTGPKFAIDAIAAGKQAAESLHRFVHEGQSLTIGRNRRDFIELDKNNLSIAASSYDNAKRERPISEHEDKPSFRDTRLVFTEEQLKRETARCLGCGASVVDTNKCVGCGVCTTKCVFDAIHLFREHPEASHMRKAEDKLKGILPYMIKRQIKISKKAKRDKKAAKAAAKAVK